MNSKIAKKIRKNTKSSFLLLLRDKPKYLPAILWRLSAIIIFNQVGLNILGGVYNLKNSIVVNGQHYKIKKI